jgi:hypothetical protein
LALCAIGIEPILKRSHILIVSNRTRRNQAPGTLVA